MNDKKIKKYILKMIWDMNDDEILHLSEEFSDLDKLKFEIDGEIIAAPEGMVEYLTDTQEILGIA